MRSFIALLAVGVLTAACDRGEAPAAEPSPAEPAPAAPPSAAPSPPAPSPAGTAVLPRTMPEALRGRWRADDLGRAPTAQDCGYAGGGNYGRVLTVRPDGYSLFETGGRIVAVHRRTGDMIEATFDTTYADMPTEARMTMTFAGTGPLRVTYAEGSDQPLATHYLPCPEG